MRQIPSCSSYSCDNICQRCPYGTDRRNMSLPRSSLGPFPDEWILSGLDKILYFCGIKNVCELAEKFPFMADINLSSSSSESCITSLICVDSRCNVTESNVSILPVEVLPSSWNKKLENVRSSCSLIRQSIGSSSVAKKQSSTGFKRPFTCIKKLADKLRKSKSDADLLTCQPVSILKACSDPCKRDSSPTRAKIVQIMSSCKIPDTRNKPAIKVSTNPTCPKPTIDGCIHRAKARPKIIETRWAMTRINIFSDCSRTYEVLEITGGLPRIVIPCGTAVFFAVLPDGSTICYDFVTTGKKK